MVTVSHHTRSCPEDISGLLISAFPGSHCVVTVISQLGFLGRGGGQGCRQEVKEALLPKNKVKILTVHIRQAFTPKGCGKQAMVFLGPLT